MILIAEQVHLLFGKNSFYSVQRVTFHILTCYIHIFNKLLSTPD